MEKDLIFFADNGLTVTSANYLANIAKENYRLLEEELNSLQFFTQTAGLLSGDTMKVVSEGVSDISSVSDKLERIAAYKSFIAWVREAIKAKERLIKEASNLSDTEIADILDITLPTIPTRKSIPTEDDVIATFNIKQRNRIYYLQTLCAELGSYIHPDGHFAEARKTLQAVLTHPNAIDGSGRDAILYKNTPSISLEQVDFIFFEIQRQYREYQAELNTIKHSIQVTIDDAVREANLEYQEATSKYALEMSEINAKIKSYKDDEICKAQALKITIPDSLMPIYDELKTIGKK